MAEWARGDCQAVIDAATSVAKAILKIGNYVHLRTLVTEPCECESMHPARVVALNILQQLSAFIRDDPCDIRHAGKIGWTG